jgi:hypothetical protein
MTAAWLASNGAHVDKGWPESEGGRSKRCQCQERLASMGSHTPCLSHHGDWPQLSLKHPMTRRLAQLHAPVTRLLGHEAKGQPHLERCRNQELGIRIMALPWPTYSPSPTTGNELSLSQLECTKLNRFITLLAWKTLSKNNKMETEHDHQTHACMTA